MKLIFVVNPKSGNGKGMKIWTSLERELTVPYELYLTEYEKQAIEIAQQLTKESNALEKPYLLIGVGGDGTYHELLNGLQGAKYITLGAVCAGSGNDFKRAFGQFRHAEEIEAFLATNQRTAHDAGILRMTDKAIHFVNNSGIGFDATVAIAANESKTKRLFNTVGLGKLSYVYYLIKCLFTFQPFSLKLEQGGRMKDYHDVWFVTASNQPFFGGGMNLSPQSNTQDGEIELTVVHNLNKYKLLFVFVTVFFGKHTIFKEVEQMKAKQFILHMAENYSMHADGEKLAIETNKGPIEFTVHPQNWYVAETNK